MSEVKGRLWPADIPFVNITREGKVAVIDGFECELRPGDYQFTSIDGDPMVPATTAEALTFVCPATNKKCGTIRIGCPDKPADNPSWQFTGNDKEPTLLPSVNCVGGCKWHGWLTNGVWKSC